MGSDVLFYVYLNKSYRTFFILEDTPLLIQSDFSNQTVKCDARTLKLHWAVFILWAVEGSPPYWGLSRCHLHRGHFKWEYPHKKKKRQNLSKPINIHTEPLFINSTIWENKTKTSQHQTNKSISSTQTQSFHSWQKCLKYFFPAQQLQTKTGSSKR